MISIKQVFDYRTPKSNGEIPLRLRVTYNRKTSHISLNVSLTENQIKKIEKGKVDRELSDLMNEVDRVTNQARRIAAELNPFSLKDLKRILAGATPIEKSAETLLVNVIDLKIDLLLKNNQNKSKSQYQTLKNLVLKFNPKISINEIDEDFLVRFEKWYIENRIEGDGKENLESYYNSLSVYLRSLKCVLNLGIDKKITDKSFHFPFGKNRYQIKTFDTDSNILTPREVDQIMTFNDFQTKYQENALDHWKICFLCNGANMSDVVQFRWEDIKDDVITFVRKKTKNKTKTVRRLSIPVIEPLKILINKRGNRNSEYIFGGFMSPPEISTIENKVSKMNKGYNLHLKVIGEKLKLRIPPIISTSRHAYGNYLAKNGISPFVIAEMMGHRSKHQLTTYHYIGELEKKTLFETNDCLNKF